MSNDPKPDTLEETVKVLKERAEADERYNNRCVLCGCKVVFEEANHAVDKGHIYSEAGKDEYANSSICEWCFDDATLPEDESDD